MQGRPDIQAVRVGGLCEAGKTGCADGSDKEKTGNRAVAQFPIFLKRRRDCDGNGAGGSGGSGWRWVNHPGHDPR